jgi:hypothetical protein
MPIEFKKLLTDAVRHAPSDRFRPADNAAGWTVDPKSSAAHSFTTPVRAAREGNRPDRAAHLERKNAFRGEIQESICARFGSQLGQKLWKKAGLDGKHWPTAKQIKDVDQLARNLVPTESLKHLGYIHADTGGGLRDDLPELNFLTAEQRQQFNMDLIDQLSEHAAFKRGTLPRELIVRMGRDLLAQNYDITQVKQARLAEALEMLSGTIETAPGRRGNPNLLDNQSVPPPLAQRALDRARAYFVANPGALANDGDVLRDLRFQAGLELKPLLLDVQMRKQSQPAALQGLARQLESRYTPDQARALLNAAANDLATDAQLDAAKINQNGARVLSLGIWRRVAADVTAAMSTPGPLRQELRMRLGNPPDDAQFAAALARAAESMRNPLLVYRYDQLATNPAAFVARQMKLDVLETEGKAALRDPATVSQLTDEEDYEIKELPSKASTALVRVQSDTAQLDGLDYASIKNDPARVLFRMAAAVPG